MQNPPKNTNTFSALVEVVEVLRSPSGCPWDRAQTHKTLTPFTLEEAHELVDAIDRGQDQDICEELGDLLLQVVLNAQVAKERGAFSISEVIQGITEKMIRRHEHVFGTKDLKTPEEVKAHWDELKKQEKPKTQNPFASIPLALPALLRSQKIGQKTIRYKFDWENTDQVLNKLDEEVLELKTAVKENDQVEIENELGDVLFTVVQIARHLNIDAESALRQANKKFETRFTKMREIVESEGQNFTELTPKVLEEYWQKAKLELA
jgi:tetrapyrrole methylase family protein/MazG family protein